MHNISTVLNRTLKYPLALLVLCNIYIAQAQQGIPMPTAKFAATDNPQWKDPAFDDNTWTTLKTTDYWENQGYKQYDGYAWYRVHVTIPSSLKDQSYWKDSLNIFLSYIDDCDDTYLNGVHIGKTGSLPTDKGGYITGCMLQRNYRVAANNPAVHWDKDNVIAVRVYDGGGLGGINNGTPAISMVDLIDGITLDYSNSFKRTNNTLAKNMCVRNTLSVPVSGGLYISYEDVISGTITPPEHSTEITIAPKSYDSLPVNIENREGYIIHYTFIEQHTKKIIQQQEAVPYILTPQPIALPRINSAKRLGVRPGSPVVYKIAATGQLPITYHADNLPEGLSVDTTTGIISGTIASTVRREYPIVLAVTNTLGSYTKQLIISVGDQLALIPPMGWNSWNCWGLSVSDAKVKSSAQAMIDKGLINHGWTYINIDDGWEAPKRLPDGSIAANSKFPDMKALGDYLHSKGLHFGIYSSPGANTCGGYLGSYQHEAQDAHSYSQWGIDYLKYDWCSFAKIAGDDTSLAMYQKPYHVMEAALKAQHRDIVFSLCQYGMADVWKWGKDVNGNCWRTTDDINDSWQSLSSIGFNQNNLYPYANPGHWNDPDMMVVGRLGWGDNLHPTNLTPDEQYTHVSLWCLLSAPLLIGCDLSKLDDFTLNLLTNDEVLALDQDVLGKEAQQFINTKDYRVWIKPLEDGSRAIGIFNTSDTYKDITIQWSDLKIGDNETVRDLWRQKDLGKMPKTFTTHVAPHGVTLIKVTQY